MASRGLCLNWRNVAVLLEVVIYFELSRSVNCKWQFLNCATVAFSEPYTLYCLPILGLIKTATAMYSHKCVRFFWCSVLFCLTLTDI